MAAEAGIPGKSQPSLSISFTVQIMIMVQHPQGIQTGDLRSVSLLPVDPPEINSCFFVWVMQIRKIRVQELLIRYVKVNELFFFPVLS